MMTGIDILVFVSYLALCIVIGLWVGGKPSDTQTYFNSKGTVPWWAVTLSIVATETSMLTIISTPSLAYLGSLTFLQIAAGYIIGRIIVAFTILPSYFKGEQETAYTFLEHRFGKNYRKLVSVTFLVTRLLADGVRLFAAAIPIKLITGLSYPESILIIAVLTLAYTFYGGLKSVIWIDVLQLGVYLSAGLFIIYWLYPDMSPVMTQTIAEADKLRFLSLPDSLNAVWTSPYNLVASLIGGAFLAMASHGTDHMMVQRLLACGNLNQARKAIIWSGFIVFFQFALFLTVGLFLFAHYGGKPLAELGLTKPDELFPRFVIEGLPVGLTGFVIAGLFAAAMSTLSSSLSALSSSTMFDLFPNLAKRADSMKFSRIFMVIWTLVFIGFGLSFTTTDNPIIEIGLSIAGFTYGGLLGAFLIGRYTQWSTASARFGLISCVTIMFIIIMFGGSLKPWWAWYTILGVSIFALFGGLYEIFSKVLGKHFR
jgi:solute:Na+ symporter, SSS family